MRGKVKQMVKRPTKTDFGPVEPNGGGVAVTFKPTASRYTFYRLIDPADWPQHGRVSFQVAQHRKSGDTDEYPEDEVRAIAHQLADLYVRRESHGQGTISGPKPYRDDD
jgi:hypothetical protein